MTDPIVLVDGVTKRHGEGHRAIEALRGVSFSVERGRFVSVTGPSGCGKTTLLHILAGIDQPTTGRVTVAGHDLGTLGADARSDLRLRQIGFVFQASNLLPSFTALENVAVPLEFQGVRWREARQRAAAVLESVGIPVPAHARLPSDLSGGEQQRVAIARAIIGRPALLLADEPTGNLDSVTGRRILDLLSELNRSEGVTIIMVTHSVLAGSYGDRTLVLEDGRVVRDVSAPSPTHLRSVAADES
ncbi:MAG: ABC transporter ATP-binding protein [bacterium]|nr:ABC transporter ATP-binding protein [bacterium]